MPFCDCKISTLESNGGKNSPWLFISLIYTSFVHMIYAGALAEKHCIQCPNQMANKWLMREEKEERIGQCNHSLALVGSRVIIEAYICSNKLPTKQLPICDHLIMEYCVFYLICY